MSRKEKRLFALSFLVKLLFNLIVILKSSENFEFENLHVIKNFKIPTCHQIFVNINFQVF